MTAETFDAARREIYLLMSRDSLARFVQTRDFGSLLDSFGSYELDDVVDVESRIFELDLELMSA